MKKPSLFIEALEPRVAPAVLVNGGNLLGGNGNPTTGETSTGGNSLTLVKVLSGQALVFWDASNAQITGISVGKHTQLQINGDIHGDIVTNLLPNGRLTDSDNNPANGEDGGILLGVGIKGITITALGAAEPGNVGRIIAGGNVKNVNVSGQVGGIYAGDGIFRDGPTAVVSTGAVDFNSIALGTQNQFVLTHDAAQTAPSASISKVAINTANQTEIFAGSGHTADDGSGQAGGSISNVTVTKTLAAQGTKPVLSLHAGDGGDGSTGGAGGSISNFDDAGSIAYVRLQTGDGGAGNSGHGGAGGALAATTITTSSTRYDLLMGHGGAGATAGGAGGGISTLNFTNSVSGGKSFVTTGDFNGDGVSDVLLTNSLTGESTLSLGHTGADGTTSYSVALQPVTNADGSAGSSPFIAALGAVPTGVVSGDFNGDGALDFAISFASTNNLGLYLGHKDGTFTASSVGLNVSPTQIAVGNFAGTSAPDIAVLTAGNLTSTTGNASSQVTLLQNDGAAHFTALANPTTLVGVGSALAVAQIDHVGMDDLFVGLQSGGVDTLLGNGTGFTRGADIVAFNTPGTANPGPVTSVDAVSDANSTTLLAFSANTNANVKTSTTVTPGLAVISVSPQGAGSLIDDLSSSVGSATAAHFVRNSTVVGVVSSGSLALYGNGLDGYTQLTSLTSDGALNDFTATAGAAGYRIVAVGAATNRFFTTAGVLGDAGLPAFSSNYTPFQPRVISFTGGDGGHGGSGSGGDGGEVSALQYTQTLDAGVLQGGGTYEVRVTGGIGGDSDAGKGGNGGDLKTLSLALDTGYQVAGQDDTTSTFLTAGRGGSGADGGTGGSVSGLKQSVVYGQVTGDLVTVGAVAVQITAGNGGVGTSGAGGDGGSIKLDGPESLQGVSHYDADALNPEAPALQIKAGDGGSGVTAGGNGGLLSKVGAQNTDLNGSTIKYNELTSALVRSGNGGGASSGNGGAGGGITDLDLGVQGFDGGLDGSVTVVSGTGGQGSGGLGGNGGTINRANIASLHADAVVGYGALVAASDGGSGDAGGGKGGNVKALSLNSASSVDAFAAVVLGGNGGAGTSGGGGGQGGSIKGLTQSKDVNSTINTIQAGDGGASAGGAGGVGGSVKKVNTVGFVGLPSISTGSGAASGQYLGVFNNVIPSETVDAIFATGSSVPQGIFAGRGGDGAANGSVVSVVARQIAAIAASVNANGTFAAADTISNVKTDLIGYDANQDGQFTSTQPGVSPATARPIDGFLLASNYGQLTVNGGSDARTPLFTFVG